MFEAWCRTLHFLKVRFHGRVRVGFLQTPEATLIPGDEHSCSGEWPVKC